MNILKEIRRNQNRKKRVMNRGEKRQLSITKLMLAAAVVVLIIILSSCSSVFTAYITGTLLDEESTEDTPLDGVTVYLYGNEQLRNADFAQWEKRGFLPEESGNAFMINTTDGNGEYIFSGFTWHDLFPQWGKTADYQDVYFLYYHRDYGLTMNTFPMRVVSDVSNTLPSVKILKLTRTVTVMGTVLDDAGQDFSEGLPGVEIYVPLEWTYTSSGDIDYTSIEWSETDIYSAAVDADGEYSVDISFPRISSAGTGGSETAPLRMVINSNLYLMEEEKNPGNADVYDDWFDIDGDSYRDDNETRGYYAFEVPGTFDDGTYTVSDDLMLSGEENSAELRGTVRDFDDSLAELQGVLVEVFVPESWVYTAGTGLFSAVEWSQASTANALTNEEGEFVIAVTYPRVPSRTDNSGKSLVRIVVSLDGYTSDEAIDADFTNGGWDRDSSGGIDPDEEDSYAELEILRNEDTPSGYNDLAFFDMAADENRSEFSLTITNLVNSDEAVENSQVTLYVPGEWTYLAPGGAVDPASIDWDEADSFTSVSNAEGEVVWDIQFPKLPSLSDNSGDTIIRIVSEKDNWVIDDDDQTTPAGGFLEHDAYIEYTIMNDTDYEKRLTMKKISFSGITLFGFLFIDKGADNNDIRDVTETVDEGLNGIDLLLFADTAPANGDSADHIFKGTRRDPDTGENGWFSFNNLEWTDAVYTTAYSSREYYLIVDADADGLFDTAEQSAALSLISDEVQGNYIEIEKD
ncbi:MAG: hypothetical protein HQ557_12730 [Bacteroidetes bacterium]|nr:hypothetical protein [Bacteroidota bacterium]